MEERDFFLEARAQRSAVLQCPFCRGTNDYDLTWLFRKKRTNINLDRLDERDRARFEKAASYMVLLDDMVMCANATCRRRFEISGVKTMAFVTPEQLEEVDFGREGRDSSRGGRSSVRGGQPYARGGQRQPGNYGGARAGQGRPPGGPSGGQGSGRAGGQSPSRQGRGAGPRQEWDDNIGNRIDDRSTPARGGYGQQGYGQQGFGKGKKQGTGGPGNHPSGPGNWQGGPGNRQGGPSNRQGAPRDVQPPRQDDGQPLRSPRGKRSDPTGPGGGWR